MPKREFTQGLHDLGQGCYAWLQPDGTWGLSNAGLVTDGEASLLVDTLYDMKRTNDMLRGFRAATRSAENIDALVNTHANGDHYFGNQAVKTPRIIASRACAEDMAAYPPSKRADHLRRWRELGDVGKWVHEILAPKFDFENTDLVLPTETFETEMTVKVGDKDVLLVNVGPAHTRGDVLAYSPKDRICFTGDILFMDAHPVIWDGPVANWIAACDRMLAWDVDVVVPGHGPLTDKKGVAQQRHYLQYVHDEVRKRYDAGMSEADCIGDVSLDPFRGWLDEERIIINVGTLYREFSGDTSERDILELYSRMYKYRQAHGHSPCGTCGALHKASDPHHAHG